MARFEFDFDPTYRKLSAAFGITPQTAVIEVLDGRLTARFGPWVVETPLSNIESVSRSGPYSKVKTAGPVRLSLVDRGITMATNDRSGLCILFKEPVTCLDPLGLLTHPGLTVTPERLDDLKQALEGTVSGEQLEEMSAEVTGESPWSILGRWARWPVGMGLATIRYAALAPSLRRSVELRPGPPPRLEVPDDRREIQAMEDGAGRAYERVYRVTFTTELSPAQVVDRILADLNAVSPSEVAEFVSRRTDDSGEVGQEFAVRMPGPWNASVRIVDRQPQSFRMATLEGHMEAGQIEFRCDAAAEPPGAVTFEIHSVARSGDRPFGFLYDRLLIASEMQMHMWAHLCRRVVEVCEGRQIGKVSIVTIRYEG